MRKEIVNDIMKGAIAKAKSMDKHVHKTLTEEEFNLSEKITQGLGEVTPKFIPVKDVKEFIKKIKEIPLIKHLHQEIDNLAGDKLR